MTKVTNCKLLVLLLIFSPFSAIPNNDKWHTVGADVSRLPLTEDDETRLIEPVELLTIESFLPLVFEMLKEPGRGFIPGDTMNYSILNGTTKADYHLFSVIYHPTGSPEHLGEYIEILSHDIFTQQINLKKGWNIFSVNLLPLNNDLKDIMQQLTAKNSLLTVQDQAGKTFENWGPFGGWVNNIGKISEKEGYKINVRNDCVLKITGRIINFPLTISLSKGWNTIAYPKKMPMDALQFLQPLIANGTLEKVLDETGNSMEPDANGEWINTIGTIKPNKGYQIKVTEAGELVIR